MTADVWTLRLCPECERDLAADRLQPYCDHDPQAAIRPPKLPTPAPTGDQ